MAEIETSEPGLRVGLDLGFCALAVVAKTITLQATMQINPRNRSPRVILSSGSLVKRDGR